MLTLGEIYAGDFSEQIMLLAMAVPPVINLVALSKVKIEIQSPKISNSLPFLYLKRIKLEQQKKIKELEAASQQKNTNEKKSN